MLYFNCKYLVIMFFKISVLILLASLVLWYLHDYHTAQFIAITRNIPILSTFMVEIHSYFGSGQKKSIASTSEHLFTASELALFKGENGEKLYICILGKVYDVENGRKHYEFGEGYHVFAGQDASRAFVTGDFSADNISDDVLDLELSDMAALKKWQDFYETQYVYKGKLIGRYYTKDGEKTDYHKLFDAKVEEAKADQGEKEHQKRIFPPCNTEWSKDQGSRVWCTTRSGGVDRDWAGVPRKLYLIGTDSFRCVCINLPVLDNPQSPQHSKRKNLGLYRDCHVESTSCYVYDD